MARNAARKSNQTSGRYGLTFQQVQKYKKGANRMGSSRLQHAAGILGAPVSYFFEGGADRPYLSGGNAPPSAYINEFVSRRMGYDLSWRSCAACLATPDRCARE